jgi:hypothetical protein
MDEFEDVAFDAHLPMTPAADGSANLRQRCATAKLVSRVYRAANDSLRARMLTQLLRPLGVLGLVAVASGAFARLARHDGLVPDTIPAEDIVRYSSEQIRELTMFVQEVNPDALQSLIEQPAQNGLGIAALSTAALVMLLRGSRARAAGSRRTDSSVDRSIGYRRSERS